MKLDIKTLFFRLFVLLFFSSLMLISVDCRLPLEDMVQTKISLIKQSFDQQIAKSNATVQELMQKNQELKLYVPCTQAQVNSTQQNVSLNCANLQNNTDREIVSNQQKMVAQQKKMSEIQNEKQRLIKIELDQLQKIIDLNEQQQIYIQNVTNQLKKNKNDKQNKNNE